MLQITVDEDVPLQAPVSRDDRLRPADLEEGSLSADLDILENDEDPDGTTDRLDVKLGAGATLLENGKVRVTVTDELQLIRYTLTDQDDLQSSAFIFVPSVEGLRPTLTSTKPLEVVSGETKEVPLSKYVTVAGGGEVVITEAREGERGQRRRLGPRQGSDDAGLHLGARLLRPGRADVRGHRRNRPG